MRCSITTEGDEALSIAANTVQRPITEREHQVKNLFIMKANEDTMITTVLTQYSPDANGIYGLLT